jgi:hypothetical protein
MTKKIKHDFIFMKEEKPFSIITTRDLQRKH